MKQTRLRRKEISHFFPCHHCEYQMPPKELKYALNQNCPKCGTGVCDIDHENSVAGVVWVEEEVHVKEMGVYELPTGEIYLVKWNRLKTRLYAMRMVEAPTKRVTEAGTYVNIDFVYERGAVYKIKPEHKMGLKRAKELIVRYGKCIVCGRKLKVAKSVERGIGPVCIKYFA